MKSFKLFWNELKFGLFVAQFGVDAGANEKQTLGARLMVMGLVMLGIMPSISFAQAPDLNQGVSKGIQFVNLVLKFLAVCMVLVGFVYFVMGIMWAIKKSRPEFATQITTGQVFGGLLGGPALTVSGGLLYMVVNAFFGSSNSVGQGIQVGN